MRDKLNELFNIDLGRLSVLGWLLMLTSLGIVVASIVVYDQATEAAEAGTSKGLPRFVAYLSLLAAALFFFGGRWALSALGRDIYRTSPKDQPSPDPSSASAAPPAPEDAARQDSGRR